MAFTIYFVYPNSLSLSFLIIHDAPSPAKDENPPLAPLYKGGWGDLKVIFYVIQHKNRMTKRN
jgi:hypothetical protein